MPAGKQAGRAGSKSVSQSDSWAAGFDRFVSGACSEGIDAAVNASEGSR